MPITFGATATLGTRLSIYLPDKDCNGHPVENIEHWIREARVLFTTYFGGCTTLSASGMWHDRAQGIFIEERTAIVTAYVDPVDVAANEPSIREFVNHYLDATKQQAVAIEYDGFLYFVTQGTMLVPA